MVHAGFRPREIVRGRLLALSAICTTMALLFGIVMVIGSRPERKGDVFLALALATLVSTSVGLAHLGRGATRTRGLSGR